MVLLRVVLIFSLLVSVGLRASEEYVIEDGGVGLTKEELDYLVKLYWSPDMRDAASKDSGDMVELLNMALASKKLALEADSISPDVNPEAYWKQVFTVRSIKSRYVVDNFVASVDMPDMSALAEERYITEKDKYARVPETRLSSHILLLCKPGECDRDPRRLEAAAILEELQAGADFSEMATRYSEDPGSKNDGGKFGRWLKMGEPQVAPHYVGALFQIEEVEGLSGIVETRFGLHVIKLDGVQEQHYLPYDEVKDKIMAALRKEYIQLAAKQFDAGYRLTDDAYIDTAAIQEILAPYEGGLEKAK